MFCPNCAAHNLEDAKFCRACGADISLVPQVMSGRMVEQRASADTGRMRARTARERQPPTMDHAIRRIFTGIAFLLIALASLRGVLGVGRWGLWMLIPALALLGEGVGAYWRVRHLQQQQQPPRGIAPSSSGAPDSAIPPPPRAGAFPSLRTGELVVPPPSVTEGTTRHLGLPVERTPKDN